MTEYYKIISDPIIIYDEAKYLKFSLIEECTPDFSQEEWEENNGMEYYIKYRTIVDALQSDITNQTVKYIKNVQDIFYYRPTKKSKNNVCYSPIENKTYYGNVNVYAIKQSNTYYDLITGNKIPSNMVFGEKAIRSSSDYEVLINHLKIIKNHKELYIAEFEKMVKMASVNKFHLDQAQEKLSLKEKASLAKLEVANQENNDKVKSLLKEIKQI